MILSGIGTHIYNEKQDKEAQAEMERERIRLGYGSWVPELEQADSQRCFFLYRVFFFLWIQSRGCKSAILRSF